MLIPPEEKPFRKLRTPSIRFSSPTTIRDIAYDIVRTGRKLWISVYLTFEKDEISLTRFKIAQMQCIDALTQIYSDFYFELLPDIEFDASELENIP